MNYIHSLYIKSGKISDTDLLYTMSVFITEPITYVSYRLPTSIVPQRQDADEIFGSWMDKYEWRPFSDMECCAIATFWKSIGDAMDIKYEGYLARSEWTDGLEFYKDVKTWAEDYERKFMVPAVSNKKMADELLPILLFYVPQAMRSLAALVIGVLMGGRLREAMMQVFPRCPCSICYTKANSITGTPHQLKYISRSSAESLQPAVLSSATSHSLDPPS
jgi:hypothetical protein